jgi:hypothetical protein
MTGHPKAKIFQVFGSLNLNPFQASNAKWRHTFHLSLTRMSFAQ